MRVLHLLALSLLVGCDAFAGEGSFDLRAAGDASYAQTGTARLRAAGGRRVVSLVRDDGPVALELDGPASAFAVGTVAVSRTAALRVRVPAILADEQVGVSGEVTLTDVSDREVAGTFDVGLATYGDEPLRTVRGTFRAVR